MNQNNNIFENFSQLFSDTRIYLVNLLDFRKDADQISTIEEIKANIQFKGATAWILICSILVASIGLNTNSIPVVIGAMLISPLMGPILGVGLSIAINDIDTLKTSLISLGTMILLSVLTSFVYFWIFDINADTSELFARTRPDIREILIAFFGGLALIIATTKKGTIATVIYGVAIATALIPPLCTAGYGIAVGDLDYFLGAMYLFIINTIFIALATFIVTKFLKFPMINYVDSIKRRRISRFATLAAIIVMIPAVWTFVNVVNESNFKNDAQSFLNSELDILPNSKYIKKNTVVQYHSEKPSVIELTTLGNDQISKEIEFVLNTKMKNYSSLNNTELIINQSVFREINNLEYMEELRSRDSLDLLSQTQKINFLEDKVQELLVLEKNYIEFPNLLKELNINYSEIDEFSYSNILKSNFKSIDTVSVFYVKWNDSLVNEVDIAAKSSQLEKWLKYKLNLDSIIIKREF
ncbi:DUF389 domain-containing protein [Flavobacteriaceae bacterium]|jgi:uncharacterized hydrophobic protein (TIGR00271 family)|nr:DUF389 domain-containing protein [Flavobacteriales bacterium]MBL6878227.1 DUF389 domain-containing protein [Flavobacteriaceae bacterium]MDA8626020.1 DUF389 domain-containing protein [Flavobacteriaceae bacterium]